MLRVSKLVRHTGKMDDHLHAWSGHVRELDSSTETLVLLRVIVLESNLNMNV